MQSAKEEPSSPLSANRQAKQTKKTRWYVAFGAVFLLLIIGFGVKIPGTSSSFDSGILISIQPFIEKGILSAQIRSDQGIATEDPEFVLINNTSLVGTVPPMAVTPKVLGAILGETTLQATTAKEIIHYVIAEGDTIESIAEHFDISPNTLLWANDLSSSSALQPGEELIVLPTSGAIHLIRPGDTVSEVALWYKGDAEDILAFNDLESAENIFVGDILIVPDGIKPKVVPNGRLTPLANSYFIYPVPRAYKITQGRHPFNAVDLSNGSCGGPAYAAAGGTIQRVQYNSGYGNYVRILHPNGVVTLYSHLASQTVQTGERISQGQIIGYIGHTGRTIPAGPAGCHLHFEVRGATNPFVK
jgi:murein DD-endopeptidase MepM/ murein hydrolase activator NlpD